MAKYLIVAYDEIYGGSNNVEDWVCFEGDYDEACEMGYEMALDVVQSYSCVMDELEEKAEERFNSTTEEYSDYLWELIEEDALFEVYKLKEDTPVDEINNHPENWEVIIDKYGTEDNK